VLNAGELDDAEVLNAIENGVCAVARRSEVTPDALVRLVKAAAAGKGALPPDLLGRLLDRVFRLGARYSNRRACTWPASPPAKPKSSASSRPACPPKRSPSSSAIHNAQ
jgi:DNA-binding NarL/FixJ family response regulator